jgi:RimJ/RimL family protein N-acetyltransferase
MRLLVRGKRVEAAKRTGIRLPPGFPDQPTRAGVLSVQLARMEADPDRLDWMFRLLVLREEPVAVGHAGFHGLPEKIGRAEIGYTVFEPWRGRGLATEAAAALVGWAGEQGQREAYLSIAPTNTYSIAIARRLGFKQVGVQIDEVAGEELVFSRALRP